jgi:Flp pilus assembly protein TadG
MRAANLRCYLRRCLRASEGNVGLIFALSVLPIMLLAGAGIDYTSAAYREDRLNAIADAAALAAVTPTMMAQSDANSAAAATSTFNAQTGAVPGITYNLKNLTVTVSDSGNTRYVTVSYIAASQNTFSQILGMPTISLSGSSQAVNISSPNIDFYLLLDDSPSMAIAATQAGINTMVSNTASQGGCAFACHESHPASDNLGNPKGEDNYALARNLGVTLRIDLLSQAAQNLMTTAQQTASINQAQYRMAIYTFDVGFNAIETLTSNLTAAQAAAAKIGVLEVYANNWLTSSNNNNDEDTNYENAMTKINSVMPAPGNGTKSASDKPQELLFIVTDGVEDECQTPALNAYKGGGCRQQYLMNSNTDWCSAIKNRGVRIAVLYTEYFPLPTNAWYVNFNGLGAGISSFQSQIGPRLKSCASPGLYFEVNVGQDISAALASLFQSAVQTARLSK